MRAKGVDQVVEHLPSKSYESLDSTPSTSEVGKSLWALVKGYQYTVQMEK
jgi:hypothetical protein